jgi:hypothetical protein
MPFDYGLRLDNLKRIANARTKPMNKNQSVDGADGLFLRSEHAIGCELVEWMHRERNQPLFDRSSSPPLSR